MELPKRRQGRDLNRQGPPNSGTAPSNGPKVTRTGPPMNSALGRVRRSRLHRAVPKRRRSNPSRPM